MANTTLRTAKLNKQDEFYTQLADIENELKHYKEQLHGKVIFCNCDDPYESNFFKYFANNFNALGLKKLIATSYVKSPIVGGQLQLFDIEGLKPDSKEPYKIEINEVPDLDNDGAISLDDVEYLLKHDKNAATPLKSEAKYNAGDFRSNECVELLKYSDIVITNPPFSLFREYIQQLVEKDKQFIIVAPDNALHYKEIFKLIKSNKLWLGYGRVKEFIQPDGTIKKMGNVGWFTNLDTTKRHETLTLYKKYSPEAYPQYDNYDAIDVSKTADIPEDYYGKMGVPDAFLDKFNPDQFELIGIPTGDSGKELGVTRNYRGRTDISVTRNGKTSCPYSRIIIKRKDGK